MNASGEVVRVAKFPSYLREYREIRRLLLALERRPKPRVQVSLEESLEKFTGGAEDEG